MGYVLFDEIASGGMASVHFGRLSGPVGFSRVVAIKRLHKHLAKEQDFVSMFLDEARLAARVRHTNVIPTIDVVAGDEIFIVMEYIQGESLSRLIRAERTKGSLVPMNYALAIMAGALHGLHAAHDATDERGAALNIVHRDVSPQNVLVGLDGVPRVFDFGVAKAAGRLQNTRDGSLKGKIPYMSPEQLAGHEVSRRSDIYSAGVMLWELLTGKRLFDADNEASIIPKIIQGQVPLPSSVNPAVPKALDDITMCGLHVDANKRYPTARAMAQELERNGGLIAGSELGDWVSALAKDAVAKRAARIHDIESRDVSEVSSGAGLMPGAHFSLSTATVPPASAGPASNPMAAYAAQAIAATSAVAAGGAVTAVSGTGGARRMHTDPALNAPGASGASVPPPPAAQLDPPYTPSVGSMPQRVSSGFPGMPRDPTTQGAMYLAQSPPKSRGGAIAAILMCALLVLGLGSFAAWRFAGHKGNAGNAGNAAHPAGSGAPSASSVATGMSAGPTSGPSAGPGDRPLTSADPGANVDAGAVPVTGASASPQTVKPARPSSNPANPANPGAAPHPPSHPPSQTQPTSAPKDDCDPPYVIDADGHKSYKRNCLQ